MTRVRAQPEPGVARAPPVLQRACACAENAGEPKCPECAEKERLGVQPKLTLSTPGDPYEREADRIADRVVSGGPLASAPLAVTPLVQRTAAEDEDAPVQRRTAGAAPRAAAGPAAAAEAVARGGRPLTTGERGYFEPRIGRDLSPIRVHDSVGSARGINARAYAHRNHIAFAPGRFDMATTAGRRLIAHELAHTLQQGATTVIRRTCPSDPAKIPAGGCKEFEEKASAIIATDAYKALNSSARGTARHIIDGARGSGCPMYYISKLELLVGTATVPGASTAASNRQIAKDAADAEQARLADPIFATMTGTEEALTGSASRQWTAQAGHGGKTFQIDKSKLDYIVIRMKVFPKPAGVGTATDVDRTKSLEDGIELEAKALGYTLDLEFVDRAGPDVFEVGVDPSQWTTAGNWAGGTRAMAHEAHHLLGLADRYNYIESHAANKNMVMGTRLHWFREQMVRAADPLAGQSLMEGSRSQSPINEQDLCAIVGGSFRDCLVGRFAIRPVGDLGAQAKRLTDRYSADKAALLQVMRDAWARKPLAERTAECDTTADPACTTPPAAKYGDPAKLGPDATAFPLANPHQQRAGSGLARKQKAPCP